MEMQLRELFPALDKLHQIHGAKELTPIYGAGQIHQPEVCLVFMNPTARNVAAVPSWEGLRAPWLGTKQIWQMLFKLGLFRNEILLDKINTLKPSQWTAEFGEELYNDVANQSLYITNIAKCTQVDARPLPNSLFREYLPLMVEELRLVKPRKIFSMGNQVSSILLSKLVSVSKYQNDQKEDLWVDIQTSFEVFPVYYPVGQGMRNMPKTIERIREVLGNGRVSSNSFE